MFKIAIKAKTHRNDKLKWGQNEKSQKYCRLEF